jgi:CPA2 family monovalent cation:H+ antiporter-2
MEQELITLGILFLFALIGGVLAARFKQPILLGLLLVGAVIGPHMLGLVKDTNMINLMIDFGAILMLFVIGLEFDLSKLKKIGLKAIIVGVLKSSIVVFTGFNVGVLLGLGIQASLFIGIILAFSSTVVIVKVLEQKEMMSREEVPLLIAVLIVEDILAVLILTFFSGMHDKSNGMIGTIQNLVISMCILFIAYIAFVKIIKPILAYVLKNNKGEEILTFTALAMCAGFSYLAYYLKLSPAAGAFLAGSIMASLPDAKQFEKVIAPYNLIISSFFFIAVGTLVNFMSIQKNLMLILILVLTVILTRLFAFGLIVYLFANFKGDKMFFSSMAMFSIGEFALLIAQESTKFEIGIDMMSISAAIVFITALLMSLTLNYSDKLYAPTRDNMPYKFRQKIDKFADYIKAISEELDLDNKYSRGLKKNFMMTLISIVIILLTIFGWRSLAVWMAINGVSYVLINIGYVVTLGIIAILLFYTIFMMHNVIKSLAEIFDNAANIRSTFHSKKIVKKAFLGFGVFWTALLWPFIMFLMGLAAVYLVVSYVLLSLSIWQFHKISSSMSDNLDVSKNYLPNYKKSGYRSNAKAVNQGWKF